jgi:hypothetical protein
MSCRKLTESSERIKLIALLEDFSNKYLMDLNNVSWKTFQNVHASSEVVSSLFTEAEDTKTLMTEFHSHLQSLKSDPGNSGKWLLLVRSYYLVAPYCEDLNRHELVSSEDYIGIRMLLPAVFDRILIPSAL